MSRLLMIIGLALFCWLVALFVLVVTAYILALLGVYVP